MTRVQSDGKRLAVFINNDFLGTGAVHLAIADAGTGALRLVGAVRLGIGEGRAWALWLPDGGISSPGESSRVTP